MPTLGDFGDGRLGDFQLGVRRPDRHGFFLYTEDHAEDSARRDYLVARLDRLEQGRVFLGPFLLGAHGHEVEHHRHQAEHAYQLDHFALGIGLRARGLGEQKVA